ncbi:MAG: hypothetical protein WCJ30_20570 [Deltaproteobacteria bacterium]
MRTRTLRPVLSLGLAVAALLVACGPPSFTNPPVTGGTIIGASPSDAWAVLSPAGSLAVHHFDGSRWSLATLPASLTPARGVASAVSAGAHGLWVAMAPAAADSPYALVRLSSTGAAEEHGSDLPMGTGPDDAIHLFGRGGSAVVQIVPTTGTSLLFRYDGQRFVAVPDPPSTIAEVVTAPGGNEIWARSPGPMGDEIHYRFDGAAWQQLDGTTLPTVGAWTATGPDNVWAPTGIAGTSMVHWNGSAFSVVTLPRETDATSGTSTTRQGSVPIGTVAAANGRALDVLVFTQQNAQGVMHADLLYRPIAGGVLGNRLVFRASLENDANGGHGFHAGSASVTVLDDGATAVQMTARTGTSSSPDTGEIAVLFVAAAGSLQ